MHFRRREHAHLLCLLIEPFQFLFMHADNQFIAIITQSKYEISFKRLCRTCHKLILLRTITVDSRSIRTDPNRTVFIHTDGLRKVLTFIFTGTRNVTEQLPRLYLIAENSLIGRIHPYISRMVCQYILNPVVSDLFSALCTGIKKRKLPGGKVLNIDTIVRAYPQLPMIIFKKSGYNLIAMLQSLVITIIKLHRHSVVAVKSIAGTQPDKTVTILNNGLDMTVRKTASTIYTDKVILPRRGKVRKEETNRKKKKQQIPFHTQILDSDKYSFFYAKCIRRMKHLLQGGQ